MKRKSSKYVYDRHKEESALCELESNHKLFFDILALSLTDGVRKRLLWSRQDNPRGLTCDDFKAVERRRLIKPRIASMPVGDSFGKAHEQDYRKPHQRLFISNQMAKAICGYDEAARIRKTLKEQLSATQTLVEGLEFRLKDVNRADKLCPEDLEDFQDLEIQRETLKRLTILKRFSAGGATNRSKTYAQRNFVIGFYGWTAAHFPYPEHSTGSNSSIGFPSLVAKIANNLFPETRHLDARDVGIIFRRNREKLQRPNRARQLLATKCLS